MINVTKPFLPPIGEYEVYLNANFQWDKLLNTDIISAEYLEGCYQLGQIYPDICSSIFCEKGK
jgi:hypothetical protein